MTGFMEVEQKEHHNKKVARHRANNMKWRSAISASKLSFRANPTKITEQRISLLLSQISVAKHLSLSPSTYGDIERGKRKVRKDRAEKIASFLKKDVNKLFKKVSENKMIALK